MKRILFSACLLVLGFFTKAQYYDNAYIRSLENKLPSTKNTDRIDLLNDISFAWQSNQDPELMKEQGKFLKTKGDSAILYAHQAYTASVKAGYRQGEGRSLVNITQGQYYTWWDEKGYPKTISPALLDSMDRNLNNALSILDQNDHKTLGQLYGLRADIVRKRLRADLHNFATNSYESIKHYELAGDTRMTAENCTWLAFDLLDAGYLNEALDISLKGLQNSKQWTPSDTSAQNREWKNYLIVQTLFNLSDISKMGGDYPGALKYLQDINDYSLKNKYAWIPCGEICEVYISMGNADSALAWQQKCKPQNYNPLNDDALARIYVMKKEYDKAIPIFTNVLSTLSYRPRIATESACELGKAYAGKGNYAEAKKYAYIALDKANAWGKRAYTMPVYELLSNIHHAQGNNDSAYLYLARFMMLKDSIQNTQFRWQLQKSQKEASVSLLLKDNLLKTQQLKQQATQRNALVALLLLLLLTGGFFWRFTNLKKKNAQLEYSRQQTELRQQAQDLEMKALKAQMNPHFIFNSLSSINWFILKNKTREASDYLTSFSRLVRMVLTNSEKPLISLDDELKMLRIYLDMEQLRLENSFDYKIELMNNIDGSEIYMPPMILQPFCENAIWHGLSHKNERGLLTINFVLSNNILLCSITDNGVGREKAEQLKNRFGHKDGSMGIQITKTRLLLFNHAKQDSEFYTIEDLRSENGEAEGTKVTLKIIPKVA